MGKADLNLEPKNWEKYCSFIEKNGKALEKKDRANLNRFRARYRIAKGLTEAKVYSAAPPFNDAVREMLRVFLAWTSFEILCKSTKEGDKDGHKKEKIINKALAIKIRKNEKLIKFLVEHVENKNLRDKVKIFSETQKDNDVSPIAQAIRHKVAHGDLTVTNADLKSDQNAKSIELLTLAILEKTEEEFEEFLRKKKIIH